jgi:hypothetical protein
MARGAGCARCVPDGGRPSGADSRVRGAGYARCVPDGGEGQVGTIRVELGVWGSWLLRALHDRIRSGLPVLREPAYADKRSKDCAAKSASE